MLTEGAYQSMFLVHENGVVVIDAPPVYAAHIPQAIAEVTTKPITHVVYSHSHIDHIGGSEGLGGQPVIIAHEETAPAAHARRGSEPAAADGDVPPTVTRSRVGGQVLELSYHGNGHEPGTSSSPRPRSGC